MVGQIPYLFAQLPGQGSPPAVAVDPWTLLTPLLSLVVGILALAAAVAVVKKYFANDPPPENADDELLGDLRALQDAGELSPQEYQRIRGVIRKRLHAEKLSGIAPADAAGSREALDATPPSTKKDGEVETEEEK